MSAEALVRWQHPQRGLMRLDEFMPVALDTGLIKAIDEWVLRTVCRHSQAWQQRGKISARISVNISNSLFHGDTLVSVVEQALGQTGLTPACLELELTESIVMRNVDASIATLTTLRTMGTALHRRFWGWLLIAQLFASFADAGGRVCPSAPAGSSPQSQLGRPQSSTQPMHRAVFV